MAPTYLARHGAIFTADGQRISVTGAKALRRFFLDDIADVETRFGETDPTTADVLQTRNLRLAAELRRAINAVRDYDPEPSVLASLPVPA